jgi:pyruvate ferredoxin oxidoreductase gamma subunit
LFQIRIHGRGGQGVVSGAEMLSVAAFIEGRHPVMAFCRIDVKPIRLREPVLEPDALIIQDCTLLHQVDLFNGLRAGGFVLLNSSRNLEELGVAELAHGTKRYRFATLPATELAMKHVGRPVPNAALLGGFAAVTGELGLESVVKAILEKFPKAIADKNVAAARAAYALAARPMEAVNA